MRTSLAILFTIAAAACPGADLYRVAGTVVNVQTGAPLARAEVDVSSSRSAQPLATATTAADGRFSFDLPEGAYVLRAGIRAVMQIYGTRNPDSVFGSAVITGPGKDTASLVFHWRPAGAVYGKIVDDSGEAVAGAFVQLMRSAVVAGQRETTNVQFGATNDLGEYRFGQLAGGAHYYLEVSARPWYANNGPNTPGDGSAFRSAYYPNTTDAGRAESLLVNPGEEKRVDFTLTSTAGATVTVKYDAPPDMSGTISLNGIGIGGFFGSPQQLPARNPRPGVPQFDQRFTGVAPGQYVVEVFGKNLSGRTAINVNGADVIVNVPLHARTTVSGTVSFKDPGIKPRGPLQVVLIPPGSSAALAVPVRADGSFSVPGAPAGRYRFTLQGTDGFFPAAVTVNGAAFNEGMLELAEGDSAVMSITASNDTGNLSGIAIDGDKPAEAVLVVLVPAVESANPALYHGYQTESDGSFDFHNVPAGKYLLFALEDTALQYANPATVRPYLGGAKAVTIGSHQSSTERVSITGLPTLP